MLQGKKSIGRINDTAVPLGVQFGFVVKTALWFQTPQNRCLLGVKMHYTGMGYLF